MAETIVETPVVAPVVETPVVKDTTNVVTPNNEPKADLFKRIADFKPEPEVKKEVAGNEFGITEEDYKKVQSDPSLSKLYKSLQAGAGKKFEEAASIRKEIEKLKNDNSVWSKERVKSLLNDPNFVNAAQAVALEQAPPNSGLTDQAWSALSETDKAKFHELEQKTARMEQLLQSQNKAQEDARLTQKYGERYAPDIVDTTISKLVRGEVNATREDIWKVINHDDNVQKAYQLGLRDASVNIKEKMGANSPEGFNATPTEKVEPVKGESDRSYWNRIVMNRILQNKK
jgi:hypothetical protein